MLLSSEVLSSMQIIFIAEISADVNCEYLKVNGINTKISIN